MGVQRESYLGGGRPVALMDAGEELRRSRRIRRLRDRLWRGVLDASEGPATVVRHLGAPGAVAGRLAPRLRRLARQASRSARAVQPLARDLDRHDTEAETLAAVVGALGRSELRAQLTAYRREKHHFVLANLGLVFKAASRYASRGLPLHDLVQDGTLGLMRAVDLFDPDKGFRFSTYAMWWIRHAIGRAISDRSRTIRVPVHLFSLRAKLRPARARLTRDLGRAPTIPELARACGVTHERIRLAEHAFSTSVISLEQPTRDNGDAIELPSADPTDALVDHLATRSLPVALSQLDTMEADVVRKRFGLERRDAMTLQQIGDEYALSRERIRQIELAALQKMRAALAE